MNKQLIGIVVDVSSSMKRNFGSLKLKRKRIDVVREAINEEFDRIKAIRKIKKSSDIRVFCIGIGFKSRLRLQSYEISDGKEEAKDDFDTVLIGGICDILSLNSFIPNSKKLESLRSGISKFWTDTSEEFVSDQGENRFELKELKSYAHNMLIESESINLGFVKNMYYKLFSLSANKKARFAEEFSSDFANRVEIKAHSLFKKYSAKYNELIHNKVTSFAEREVSLIVERSTLGFSLDQILSEFDRTKLGVLSKEIHREIKADLQSEFKTLWIDNRLDLWLFKFKYLSKIRLSELERVTELVIKSYGWSQLEPFVREVVTSIFEGVFSKVIHNSMEKWIQMSTVKETTLSIDKLEGIFPSIEEESLYNEDYIFGGTPMYDAVNRCALRFNEEAYDNYDKVLLIISDGEFEKYSSIKWTIDLLKKSGVTIACGLISKSKVLNKFQLFIKSTTIDGTKNLMELSSTFKDLKTKKQNLEVSDKHKICLRLSRPKIIKELINSLLEN